MAVAERGRGPSALLAGAALFAGAFLLFWVQPLAARMALPRLGGVPAVWSTALVFFQAALLAGYLYAHLISRLPPRVQAAVHGALLAVCLAFLPPSLDPAPAAAAAGGTALRLLLAMVAALGLPAVLLSSTAPLLQGWFGRSGRPGAEDPYFLYAASNTGSLAALLAFPALLEPLFPLRQQAWLWAGGFVLFAGLSLAGALAHGPAAAAADGGTGRRGPGRGVPPSARAQARWLLLAAAPSSLLLGTTTHLTTDVASVPLVWVVPLALYLTTYIMAFARRTVLPAGWVLAGQAAAVVALAVVLAYGVPSAEKSAALFPVHLAAFFLTSLVCHRELAGSRPPAEHLTRFYLVLAAGGALGGAFNALLAPSLFRTLVEYPLVLGAACLLRPSGAPDPGRRARRLDAALPAALFAALTVAGLALRPAAGGRWLLLALGGAACLLWSRRPLRFALALAALVVAGRLGHAPLGAVLAAERNFFGPVEVIGTGGSRILYHGRTIHGAQVTGGGHRAKPLAYYTTAGPLGDAFRALGPRLEGARIAVVGLGAGSLAAYGRPGQRLDFFEINPAVAAMAREPQLFTYLADSAAAVSVHIGDGRAGLDAAADGDYALIVVDAFNSDAVPVHLLTREAVALYLRKLAPGGALLFNVTNDYLDLEAVLGRVAAAAGLAAVTRVDDEAVAVTDEIPFKLPSDWMALARSETALGGLSRVPGWRPPRYRAADRPWSDDYSSVLAAFRGL
jgi:hypothetical protein